MLAPIDREGTMGPTLGRILGWFKVVCCRTNRGGEKDEGEWMEPLPRRPPSDPMKAVSAGRDIPPGDDTSSSSSGRGSQGKKAGGGGSVASAGSLQWESLVQNLQTATHEDLHHAKFDRKVVERVNSMDHDANRRCSIATMGTWMTTDKSLFPNGFGGRQDEEEVDEQGDNVGGGDGEARQGPIMPGGVIRQDSLSVAFQESSASLGPRAMKEHEEDLSISDASSGDFFREEELSMSDTSRGAFFEGDGGGDGRSA